MDFAILTVVLLGLITSYLCLRKLRRVLRATHALERKILLERRNMETFVWSTVSVQRHRAPGHFLPPINGFSMYPDLISIILEHIEKTKPQLVVEFGSGMSTIFIGELLKRQGGRLISIEHDAEYARAQQQSLKKFEIEDFVDLRVAPISEKRHAPFNLPWYQSDILDDIDTVDLVIVDGPPMAIGDEVRYPGVAMFADRLSPGGAIILDDADRPGEKSIEKQMRETFPKMLYRRAHTIKGALIIEQPNKSGR